MFVLHYVYTPRIKVLLEKFKSSIQCQVTEICHLNNVIDELIENVSIIYSYWESYRVFSNNQTNIYLFKIN